MLRTFAAFRLVIGSDFDSNINVVFEDDCF